MITCKNYEYAISNSFHVFQLHLVKLCCNRSNIFLQLGISIEICVNRLKNLSGCIWQYSYPLYNAFWYILIVGIQTSCSIVKCARRIGICTSCNWHSFSAMQKMSVLRFYHDKWKMGRKCQANLFSGTSHNEISRAI